MIFKNFFYYNKSVSKEALFCYSLDYAVVERVAELLSDYLHGLGDLLVLGLQLGLLHFQLGASVQPMVTGCDMIF